MLKYSKVILEKVSFDNKLFEKELNKAISWLATPEIDELRAWSFEMFGNVYGPIIEKCFEML